MANSPQEWYESLPLISKYYMSACFLSTCLYTMGLLNPYNIHLDFELVWQKFQIWRLVTCFMFLGKFSFPFLMQLMILGQYSPRLEMDPFPTGGGPTADYMFMLLFGGSIMLVVSYFFQFAFPGMSLIFMIIYVWSRRDPEQPISIWGFKTKSLYLPWAMIAFTVLIGGSPIMDIVGVAAGHVYYFLHEILPTTHNMEVLKTPQFLVNWFPPTQTYATMGRGAAPRSSNTSQGNTPTRNWGSGRTLGSS